jgi:predicted nucleotide-binding protein (sugar kinase/HSP70/actin superfamily)
VPIATWRKWFAPTRSTAALFAPAPTAEHARGPGKPRATLRVGIPRALNVWSTHRFWLGLLTDLGLDPRNIVFSSETSEEQGRQFGGGRGAVDCCYPVKCMTGHYGELLTGLKTPIDVLLSPKIYTLPSFLDGAVVNSLSCPRVMAAPENIRGGFTKEGDAFAAANILHLSPLVSLAERILVPRQLHPDLARMLPGLKLAEVERAVAAGYGALAAFDRDLRRAAREILEDCAARNRPALLVLARPYHMDPGIGHELEAELQAAGYPILWGQHLPLDADLLADLFGPEIARGESRDALDIADVWPSSYSANTNEILWAAKFAARHPWIAGVIRLSSYECGMDQPTYTPVKEIVERSGTLFFSFQDLDATKPAGSTRIRIETILHYLDRQWPAIVARKQARIAAAPSAPSFGRPAGHAMLCRPAST